MAATDRFMIAPLTGGLETGLRPWMIPDDAFSRMQNAYVFRGRVRKRFGAKLLNSNVSVGVQQLYSRLAINLGTTDGSGDITGTVPGNVFAIGQMFAIGDDFFTVIATGTPGNLLRSDGIGATATYNTTTGAYVINGATASTALYFYPSLPVMGFLQYYTDQVNDEPLIAFDTRFAYEYTGSHWERIGSSTTIPNAGIWSGTDAQFFWGATWRSDDASAPLFFVVNNNAADQVQYWNGTAWTRVAFPFLAAANNTILTSKIIMVFHNRLIMLNTTELVNDVQKTFVNRCRFAQFGSPIDVNGGASIVSWRQDLGGRGGWVDAPTQEAIISAQFIKDRLIVFFESSTWELVYNGNQVAPFGWQQINTELGTEASFSTVPFDKHIITVGNVGIHACNGANVARIDQNIPQIVFDVHSDNNGIDRIYGIRDYYAELVYWTFPIATNVLPGVNDKYPTRILVYNYNTGSWAFNDDSITAFGYFYDLSNATWETTTSTWEQNSEYWAGPSLVGKVIRVIAGNQEGFTFLVDIDHTRNSPSLQITNISAAGAIITITAINHNLHIEDWIALENILGITGLNDGIYQVDSTPTANTFTIFALGVSGTYLGGGTIALVSNIDIMTKQFNFYVKQGRDAYVSKVDFLVDRTSNGEITINAFDSYGNLSTIEGGIQTGSIVGSSVLETYAYPSITREQSQSQLWHPVYFQAEGEAVQFEFTMKPIQMRVPAIAWADFQLHAMTIYATPTTSRLQ